MGSLFWQERQKKAEGSRGRGTTGSSQSPLPPIDWRQRRPPEYLLLSFVFCSFFFSLRCWEVLCLFICLLFRSSVFSSILPFTWSTISSIYEPNKERGEAERQGERDRGGGFFSPLFILFPPVFIHSFFPLHPLSLAAHAPSSLHRLLPPPLRPRPPVTLATFLFFNSIRLFYFFPLTTFDRVF